MEEPTDITDQVSTLLADPVYGPALWGCLKDMRDGAVLNVVLEGVVGSKAYGLDTPDSDEDRLGVFVAPTSEVLGLHWNRRKESVVRHSPDATYHEVGKLIRLALKCNPTVIEILYLDEYLTMTPAGYSLYSHSKSFLSTRAVRDSYGGYAKSQVTRLVARGSLSAAIGKNARHAFRLLYQGHELLTTGSLTMRMTPEQRTRCFEMGELAVTDVDRFVAEFEKEDRLFLGAKSVLPDTPDFYTANELLIDVRRHHHFRAVNERLVDAANEVEALLGLINRMDGCILRGGPSNYREFLSAADRDRLRKATGELGRGGL